MKRHYSLLIGSTRELRPTGRDGALQPWPFSADCWQEGRTMAPDLAGYVKSLYAIFEIDPIATRPGIGPLRGIGELEARPAR